MSSKLDPLVYREWQMARGVIADFLDNWLHAGPTRKQYDDAATAILARLASHNPPLLVCTADVFDQRDALLEALKYANDFINKCVDWYGPDPNMEKINSAIALAEKTT